jgi:hypothetical protein
MRRARSRIESRICLFDSAKNSFDAVAWPLTFDPFGSGQHSSTAWRARRHQILRTESGCQRGASRIAFPCRFRHDLQATGWFKPQCVEAARRWSPKREIAIRLTAWGWLEPRAPARVKARCFALRIFAGEVSESPRLLRQILRPCGAIDFASAIPLGRFERLTKLARLRLRPTSRVECAVHSRRLGLAHRRNCLRRSNRDLLAKSVRTPPLGISPLKALTVSIRVVPE